MSKTSGGFESSGGPKMPEHKGYEGSGGPKMKDTSGGFEGVGTPKGQRVSEYEGKGKRSRYPTTKQKQSSSYKEEVM